MAVVASSVKEGGGGDGNSMSSGDTVLVVYVHKEDAKRYKNAFEDADVIHQDYRMTAPVNASLPDNVNEDCIAIPITLSEAIVREQSHAALHGILGWGYQPCPYSTSLLGNHMHRSPKKSQQTQHNNISDGKNQHLSLVKQALLHTLCDVANNVDTSIVKQQICSLDITVCPDKVELLGDDNTIVLSRTAFDISNASFIALLRVYGVNNDEGLSDASNPTTTLTFDDFYVMLWSRLAELYDSPRVVRKGDIDPNSAVRQSGYKILWLSSKYDQDTAIHDKPVRGPSSPGWITVTEQGIRQSFDLTLVMFSRGNITEKIRFGKLVQPYEVVLDLYGGIGYFTLPALVHGQAEYVYACEWNKNAVQALQYNVHDNNVEDRVTILQGDCRKLAVEHNLINMFDRVSLGLLPSSEGGWKTAVYAIRQSTGGWLHVHGNVPVSEVYKWALWMCQQLRNYAIEAGFDRTSTVVICTHVEKVKSFAPHVKHYVADVYIGRLDKCRSGKLEQFNIDANFTGVVVSYEKDGHCELMACTDDCDIEPPSCALSKDGVICQEWMF